MRDLKKHEGLHPIHVDALKIIERHGWHVMSVCPRKDSVDKQEWFSYSTGLLFSYNHPEIILCGLSSRTAHAIINEIGNAVASGRKYDLDKDYTDIFADDVKCRFRRMHFSWYSEYVLLSRWFYEDDQFPVWQCFWPDEEGFYPWDAACDPEVIESQPKLYESALPIC